MTDAQYIAAAREEYECEGDVEFDDNPVVSRGSDCGAYVAAWVWVYNGSSHVGSDADNDHVNPSWSIKKATIVEE